MMDFDSLNPYQSLTSVTGDSPEDLVAKLKSIMTPIKILSITSSGTKQVAYITGDIRIKPKPKREK